MNAIRKCFFVAVAFLLSGCPGPGDRMISREFTTVTIKDNHVCVISPLNPDEKITAVQINSNKSSYLHRIFNDSPIYVAKGECLPLFGVHLEPGQHYSIAWDIESGKASTHLVMLEFSITVDSSGEVTIH